MVRLSSSLLTIASLLLAACDPNSPAAQERALREKFELSLKDPSSAQYQGDFLHGSPGHFALCGVVNAKNSFGGYTGNSRFISAQDGLVEMDGVSLDRTAKFATDWFEYCVK